MQNTTSGSRHFLILFDIDGTLVRMEEGLPHRLFSDMMRELFGAEISMNGYRFAGKTDRGILREIFAMAKIPADEAFARESEIREWIARELEPRLTPRSLRLLPNVRVIVEQLHARKDTTLALLTGNLPETAEIKLRPFDLGRFFAFGVYGIESEERNDLGPIALDRAIEYLDGKPLSAENVVVIGDSVRDVECAKAIGARCIVVLTGSTTRKEVTPYHPEFIVDDLSDTQTILDAIYGAN